MIFWESRSCSGRFMYCLALGRIQVTLRLFILPHWLESIRLYMKRRKLTALPASWRIVHIDIPGIMPTAIIILILNIGGIMSVGFEKVYLLQNPLNLSTSEVISTYVYKIGLLNANFSFATAVGLFNSIINVALLLFVNTIAKRISSTSLW